MKHSVAGVIGLNSFSAEMKPQDKLEWVQDQQNRQIATGRSASVGMIGGGINDAPSLAQADVGIAMGGGGAALAVDAADVALMSDNIKIVSSLVLLGRYCQRIIWENIIFSVAVKLVLLYFALTGKIQVWLAVLGDVGTLLIVIFNGLRPLGYTMA